MSRCVHWPTNHMFGIYIHWPYCLKKCPYCSFNSHLTKSAVDVQAWTKAFQAELAFMHQHTAHHTVSSIFFGGGTPSLMPPELILSILQCIESLWGSLPSEISLEANPLTCSLELFQSLKQCKITRISLGIQSLSNADLTFLGRQHTRSIAINSLKSALRIFDNVSCDLIYGLPSQTLTQWRHCIQEVLSLNPPHISLYQLTIENNTPFYFAEKRKDWVMPNNETQAKFLRMTWQILAEHGFTRYEISNFTQAGKECKHNQTYWHYHDYIGVGPGAHGRFAIDQNRYQTVSWKHPEKWLASALSSNGTEIFQKLTPQEATREYIPMGLRAASGISWKRLEALAQCPRTSIIDQQKFDFLKQLHFIQESQNHFWLTEKGSMMADAIAQEILLS